MLLPVGYYVLDEQGGMRDQGGGGRSLSVSLARNSRSKISTYTRSQEMVATLFLDFDGVLHSMSGYGDDEPFCKLPLLEDLISDVEVDIVVSSSWRFQHSLDELRTLLGKLGSKVVETTGEAYVGRHARYNEILQCVERHNINNWRALDDASYEFPSNEMRLIACDPNTGVGDFQLMQLAQWLQRGF